MLEVKGYCRVPGNKKLAMWQTDVQVFTHDGEVERLIHDLTKEAEKVHKGFKGPALLLITPLKKDPAKDRLDGLLSLLGNNDPMHKSDGEIKDQIESEVEQPEPPEPPSPRMA
jgi:hypothetical protein